LKLTDTMKKLIQKMVGLWWTFLLFFDFLCILIIDWTMGLEILYIYIESYLKSAEVKAHTISGDTTHMPNLAKQNATFLMNSIHNWLPCFHLLFSPNSRCFRISLNQIRKINENHGNMLKIIYIFYIHKLQ
jgi:hypothetical protein